MSSVCSMFLVIQLLRCVRALNGPPTLKKNVKNFVTFVLIISYSL